MIKTLYAIYNHHNKKVVAGPFDREEQIGYIEYEYRPGDAPIFSGDNCITWNFVGGQLPVAEFDLR